MSNLLDRARRFPRSVASRVVRGGVAAGLLPRSLVREDGAVSADESSVMTMRAYGERAREAGLDRLYLLLSFDCDTDEDIDAAQELHPWLDGLGIRSSYAVPGAQLRRGAAAYGKLARAGAEFLNHGGQPHAEWRETRYYGVTFYNEMEPSAVVEDIHEGHRAVQEVTGSAPTGFRAPHFGCFQSPEQLDLVYRTARDLGYGYCSTTIPQFALDRGPYFDVGGLVEIPVFGSWRYPPTILDSWTYLTDRTDYALGEEYFSLFEETLERMLAEGIPGILSYYVDPVHVAGQTPFIRAMELASARGVPSLHFSDVLGMTSHGGLTE